MKTQSDAKQLTLFQERLKPLNLFPLRATGLEVLQINLGKMCNQKCHHCHVDAGPERTEIMTRETMIACLSALSRSPARIVDLTGGAPEMNPDFRWFVSEIRKLERHVIVRSNLTILMTQRFSDYPNFFKDNCVEVIASLPCYTEANTDAQRGQGVFEKSIAALKRLNALGYGQEGTNLTLNLVYNPGGPFLPPSQKALEVDYKRELKQAYGIVFNNLFTITNMPIRRFEDDLKASNKYDFYMNRLHDAFNPAAAKNVMCRSLLSVGWDGQLYDCDFNQMLDMTVDSGIPAHIDNFDFERLRSRAIVTGNHCYGCAAGAGSSCGGTVV